MPALRLTDSTSHPSRQVVAMTKRFFSWPRLVFILVPLLIVIVDTVVLVAEHLQSDGDRAIRLVRETSSRKENFSIQQYLYMTIYHRKTSGEPINIDGWRAAAGSVAGAPIIVEFRFSDASREHLATWEVDLRSGSVTPKNEAALVLTWH